jgi:hypothetical protein
MEDIHLEEVNDHARADSVTRTPFLAPLHTYWTGSHNHDFSRAQPSLLPLDGRVSHDDSSSSSPPILTPPAAAVGRDHIYSSVASHIRNRSVSDLGTPLSTAGQAETPSEILRCSTRRKPVSSNRHASATHIVRLPVSLPQQPVPEQISSVCPPTYEEALGRLDSSSTFKTPPAMPPPQHESHNSAQKKSGYKQESELKELGLLVATTPRTQHRVPPDETTPISRQDGRLANGTVMSRHALRDRARSYELRPGLSHLPGGQWQLQVSVLDQTGVGSGQRSPSFSVDGSSQASEERNQGRPVDPTSAQSLPQRPSLSSSAQVPRAPQHKEAKAPVTRPPSRGLRMQARLSGPPELMPYFN